MPQKCLDWGQLPPPLENVQIQAEKSASNNLDSGWTPPAFGQSPNTSRFACGMASLMTVDTLAATYIKHILSVWTGQLEIRKFAKIVWANIGNFYRLAVGILTTS